MMTEIVFWFIVTLTIFSAFFVVQSTNLLYSAYALLFTFIGIAGLYIFLWADFMAVMQIIIYVGGILILVVFGIMLTNKITTVNISHTSLQRKLGALIAGILFMALGSMILNTTWNLKPALEPDQTVATVGKLLMMDYLLPFELVSILLLGPLIAATTLSRKDY